MPIKFCSEAFFQAWSSLTSLKSDTRDPSLKSLLEDLCSGFLRPEKYLSTLAGFELANLGSRGEHITPRPPRPTCGAFTKKLLSNDKINIRISRENRPILKSVFAVSGIDGGDYDVLTRVLKGLYSYVRWDIRQEACSVSLRHLTTNTGDTSYTTSALHSSSPTCHVSLPSNRIAIFIYCILFNDRHVAWDQSRFKKYDSIASLSLLYFPPPKAIPH